MIDIEDVFKWLDVAGIQCEDSLSQRALGLSILDEEFKELWQGLVTGDKKEIMDGGTDFLWVFANNLRFHGISLEEFLEYAKKVSESNWSKFCSTLEEAQETIDAYQEGRHPNKPGECINCYFTKVGDKFVVYRHDGKVMKSINFKEVG